PRPGGPEGPPPARRDRAGCRGLELSPFSRHLSARRKSRSGTRAMTTTQETAGAGPESRAFEADVARLLQLMVHAVYSDKDVFLRELISNAADACERLRYEAIA